jgi:2-methylfumaryl-CoA isomerase
VTGHDDQPLAGLRVVEGSAFVAAPSGGMTLALLGADVIRFDQLGGGLDHRRWPLTPDGTSIYWAGLNRGKRSFVGDLRSPEVRELLSALICAPGPDRGVFLTNFPPVGWMDPSVLRQRREDLIAVVVTGNHDGTTALDYTVNCAVGYPSATGPADDDRPVNHVLPAWDLLCGQQAALAVLAAERRRVRTGAGGTVTLALADVALWAVAALGHVAEAQLLGAERARYGNDLYGAYGRDFPTADGRRVMVVAITPKQWSALLAATGTAEAVGLLAARGGWDFADEGQRFLARDALGDLFAPWFAGRRLAEVRAALDEHGVCWGPYQTFRQLVEEDPRCSAANPLFATVDQPGLGPVLAASVPMAFAGLERPHPVAPVLGAHTEQILAEELGLAPAEVGRLFDAGLVAGPARAPGAAPPTPR